MNMQIPDVNFIRVFLLYTPQLALRIAMSPQRGQAGAAKRELVT
jgi:hypothetical protein